MLQGLVSLIDKNAFSVTQNTGYCTEIIKWQGCSEVASHWEISNMDRIDVVSIAPVCDKAEKSTEMPLAF